MKADFEPLSQGLIELAQDTSVGQHCCSNMVVRLGRLLNVRYVFVGLLDADGAHVETLAVAVDGAIAPNLRYSLSGTPCANVIGQSMCLHAADVIQAFPEDLLLQEMGVTSYLGAPVFDTNGQGIGLLVLLDSKPLVDTPQLRSLVQTHAARVGVEIDRWRYEQRLESLSTSLEKEVQRRTADLEEANRQLAAFAYCVSHDLRAPLRHIMGYGQLLAELDGVSNDPEARQYADIMLKAGQRMAGMMEALLECARNSRAKPQCNWIDLEGMIDEVLVQLRDITPATLTVSRVGLGRIWADPALMRIVLLNLVGNAIKYSSKRDNPRISLRMHAHGDHDEIVIADNGVGFDMGQASKIFDVFQRLHTEREFPGHGVGLASAKGIINQHGGQITCASVKDQGASFSITLPHP